MTNGKSLVLLGILLSAGLAQAAPMTPELELAAEEEEGATALATPEELVLESELVRVAIERGHLTTTRTMTWHNTSGARLEGRAVVRAGEGAQVLGFAYWNGSKKIVGEVFEKEVAQQVYQEVTGLGRDPGLLEQVGEGAFTFRVFPIEPDEHKKIEIRTARLATRVGDSYELRLPVGAKADVAIELAEGRHVKEVTSSTHKLAVARTAVGARIVPQVSTEGEVVVKVTLDERPWSPAVDVHRDPGNDAYVMVRLAVPEGAARPAVVPKDVTLVIDHSGSMSGAPLERAIEAAVEVVRRLRPTDRVNVIMFDDKVEHLFDRPRTADAATLKVAEDYLGKIQSAGGTDIAKALTDALGAQVKDDHPDLILFFTDGQSDPTAALAAAAADPGDARVFTIGLGDGVTKPLLSRLASDKRGRFTFIARPEEIEDRVAHLYEQLEAPVLTDLALEAGGVGLDDVYPRTLPDLAVGDELVVVGRVHGQGALSVKLTGKSNGQLVAYTAQATIPAATRAPWVGRLWAKGRVDDLLEEIALRGETEELKTEVVELALAYEHVTPYTSFLAIPEEEVTGAVADTLASARDRKAKIRQAHKDAVALSRDTMPPGDPVISVRAPADARSVTAHFPFGLVKDLTFDPAADAWRVRFLVPKDVVDGNYEAVIVVVRADGSVEIARARYTIDASAPDFLVETIAAPGGVMVKVTTRDVASLVTVADVADPRRRLDLVASDATGTVFQGFVALPAGSVDLRVVVADKARNEADQRISFVVEE